MRYCRKIFDRRYAYTGGGYRAYRTLSAVARAAYMHFNFSHAGIVGKPSRYLGGNLRGKRRAFARSFKSRLAGRIPADNIAVCIGNIDNRVVKRGPYMDNAFG
jgi:hypothetical protein